MKAIRYHRTGEPEVLQLDDVEKPSPGDDEVLIRIQRCGVNFADTLQRRGLYVLQPTPPVIPGLEAAGTIEEAGSAVRGFSKGQRVAVLGMKLYAEYATAKPGQLIPLPEGVDMDTGAAFPVQGLTAYHLLYTAHEVKAGQTVLVHSAAGGVGLLTVQMAKLAGARVIGTVSTEAKAASAKEMGADEVINYRESDFAEETMRLTNGRGVDCILDAVGKDTFRKGIGVLAPHGNLVLYGRASGSAESISPEVLLPESKRITGFILYTVNADPQRSKAGVEAVLGMLSSGTLRMTISHRIPLTEAARAHRLLENRQTIGKVLLTTEG